MAYALSTGTLFWILLSRVSLMDFRHPLFPKDLDAQASTIRVLHGKGDHDRVVGLELDAMTEAFFTSIRRIMEEPA